jgi:glycosyltransferase involved in cell wall biosynthesis
MAEQSGLVSLRPAELITLPANPAHTPVTQASAKQNARPLRVAIIADFLEEQWPSMDLVAETIVERLEAQHDDDIKPGLIRPSMPRRFSRLAPRSVRMRDADRLAARFIDYPAILGRIRDEFDLYHIIDHSYAHLVHYLRPDRTVVTCHDVDTFRCLFMPDIEHRSELFRAMTRRILRGLQLATRICCVSGATRDELLRFAIAPTDRITVIHNGVSPEFGLQTDAAAENEVTRMLGPISPAAIEFLHVGSSTSRKRIDVLLRTFAGVRKHWPGARLIRVGGFTRNQEALATHLHLRDAIAVLRALDRRILAAIYRRATLVLITSDAEGFGLPMIEALACGTPVLASSIPALREIGGTVAEYTPAGDVEGWVTKVNELLAERAADPARWLARQKAAPVRAREFSWDDSTAKLVQVYRAIML